MTADEKLKLIEDPVRRAIKQLRIFADDNTLGICDEGQCSMSNLALWLEGVLDENPGYMPWCSETARVKLGWPNLLMRNPFVNYVITTVIDKWVGFSRVFKIFMEGFNSNARHEQQKSGLWRKCVS